MKLDNIAQSDTRPINEMDAEEKTMKKKMSNQDSTMVLTAPRTRKKKAKGNYDRRTPNEGIAANAHRQTLFSHWFVDSAEAVNKLSYVFLDGRITTSGWVLLQLADVVFQALIHEFSPKDVIHAERIDRENSDLFRRKGIVVAQHLQQRLYHVRSLQRGDKLITVPHKIAQRTRRILPCLRVTAC